MDDEDREAEECYINVDSYMNSRRKDHREKRIQEELVKFRKENPTINDQFKDAKRQLSTLSVDEWMAIPEAHDFKVKKQKREKYVPVPDKIIEAGRSEG
jgi:pre-mRNA-processing factor 6